MQSKNEGYQVRANLSPLGDHQICDLLDEIEVGIRDPGNPKTFADLASGLR